MNISNQLRNYRKKLNISQEELAEVVHVSRQTISNWENNKSYPDLQSLVLISEYFKISLDELVKGDIVNMKSQLERNEMIKYANGMGIASVLMILSIPFAKRVPSYGIIAMLIFAGLLLWCAFKAEKIKKDKNIQTYKEILAYMEKGEIPNKDKKVKGSMLQKICYPVVAALITGGLAFILLKYF